MNKLLVCTHKENKQTKKPKKIPPKNPNKKQNQKNPQYSVWFRNHIQRNKFSCRVIIAVVPLIALHDWPQTASREGNKTFHGLGCRSAASLCLSQATELHRVWTWSCGSFHCGSVFLPWMGIILLVLVLLLDKPFSAFSCRSQGMLGSLLTSSWAWRINPEWTSLPGGPVWHSLQARYEPYSLGRDECSRISVFHPHRMIFFFLYLLPYESLEVNLFVSQGKKKKPCEKFCFMLPDMVALGLQLSLRTELSAPWVSWERLKQCLMGTDHPGVFTGCAFAQETYCPRIHWTLL